MDISHESQDVVRFLLLGNVENQKVRHNGFPKMVGYAPLLRIGEADEMSQCEGMHPRYQQQFQEGSTLSTSRRVKDLTA